MSDQQNTGGSNICLMMGLIAAGEMALVGGGYTLYSYFSAPSSEVSSVNLTQVGSSVQVNAPEQQDYRERLRESNAEGALAAAARNTSFIASIPLQQDVVMPKPVTVVTSVAAAAPPRQQQAS